MRVLISAYACQPGEGSEPGAAWLWASAAAERHDVWLLTDARSEPAVAAELARCPSLRITPIYIASPLSPGESWRKTDRLRYVLWQRRLPATMRRLHAEHSFDVVHHLTIGADWLPVGSTGLADVPFVWGPVGGCAPVLPMLWARVGPSVLCEELARLAVTASARKLIGEGIARRADLVVTQNSDVAARYRRLADVTVEQTASVHTHEIEAALRDPLPNSCGDNRSAVFVGRLLRWKGISLAIQALSRPEAAGWHLSFIGVGSDRAYAERLVQRLDLSDRVHFEGSIPRSSVLRRLASADALLFPSLHDSAAWIVAEALSLGCPVVCLDVTGPGEMVSTGDGVKVPPKGDVVVALARGLASIHGRITPRQSWSADRSAAVIDSWYERAVSTRAKRCG